MQTKEKNSKHSLLTVATMLANTNEGDMSKVTEFLPESLRSVILNRFGKDKNLTLEQIAASKGVTKQRIQQLQARALSRIYDEKMDVLQKLTKVSMGDMKKSSKRYITRSIS